MAPQTPHAHTLARGARAFRGGRRRLSVLLAVTALLLGAVALVKAYQVGGKVGLLGSKWTPAEQLNRYAAHEVTRRAAHLQKEQARLARKAAAKAKRKGGDGDDEGPADYDERRRRRRR